MLPRHLLHTAHPWHGVSPGKDCPKRVTVYVEIVPTDTVKYELDKESGQLKVDRVQRYSSFCPTLYGFVPQTLCDVEVGRRAEHVGVTAGDQDPLDICVLTEHSIPKGGFLLQARPVGGLRMLDGAEVDDKIIAVLEDDLIYGHLKEISQVPVAIVDRLRHYFLSYKQLPGESPRRVDIPEVYDCAEAEAVIRSSLSDYENRFGKIADRVR